MDKHCVYFIGAIHPTENTLGAIKIGKSDNPQGRLQGLQTSNHYNLVLMATIECGTSSEAHSLEGMYHKRYASNRLRPRSEWYSVTSELLVDIYQMHEYNPKPIEPELEPEPDTISDWLKLQDISVVSAISSRSAVIASYHSYCEGKGIVPETNRTFWSKLRSGGYNVDARKRINGKQERVVRGITL